MIHLRIVAPSDRSERALEVLTASDCVTNVITLPGAARRPDGDVILCDVAREDASVVLADLRELNIHRDGSIALEEIDTAISRAADDAEHSAQGLPSDAVIWEQVEHRTSEDADLSVSFLLFISLATLIAAVGIYLNSPILIVGAMVVGPEFGPLAGLCVALVERRGPLALRSFRALAIGFPVAITCAYVATLIFRATGLLPHDIDIEQHSLASTISSPDFFAGFVAFCAGIAGMLSLTTAKSGALIGVLISVTTIPSAANIGVACAYRSWSSWRGSIEMLALNLALLALAGVLTLGVQRGVYAHRRRRHERHITASPTPRASSAPATPPRS